MDLKFKELILSKIPKEYLDISQKELDIYETTLNKNEKPLISDIELLYKEVQKDGVKGKENPYNSWVLYFLGITEKKPSGQFDIKLFDKRVFARPSPPDIDIDVSYLKRPLIMDYFVKKYGRNRVGNIATSSTLKLRSAITRVGKAVDVADAYELGPALYTSENVKKINEILEPIPKKSIIKVHDENGEEVVVKTINDAVKYFPDFKFYMEKYPQLYKYAVAVEGLQSSGSVHASGVILSDISLEKIAPLRTTNGEDLACQFAMEDLEHIGLIKFDWLGLATLDIIDECLRLVKENVGIDLEINKIPLDDKKTFELYQKGDLIGVFQCESYGMIDTCKKIEVSRFEDIMVAIALYRPGPMKYIENYANRKKGLEKVDYLHPILEKYLKPIVGDQFGILAYQENIMRICVDLAGMSPSKALIIIKGIGKKKEDLILKGKSLFIEGCVKKGVPRKVAENYWDNYIMPFSLYGFNLAHSLEYGFLSYQTAYLKANFPEEFMVANLNVTLARRVMDDLPFYEKECKKRKIEILPKDINLCDLEYKIVSKRDPLNGIMTSQIRPPVLCKGMPSSAAEEIVKNRPYKNLMDLVRKTEANFVTADAIGALFDAGFFSKEYKKDKDKLLKDFKTMREDIKKTDKEGGEIRNIFEE